MKKIVAHKNEGEVQQLTAGTFRCIRCYDEHMMAVEVYFEKDGLGAPHTHPHSQISYVLSGTFVYTIEDTPYTISTGDSIVVPPNAVHSCLCLDAGTLLDVFAPMRADFLG